MPEIYIPNEVVDGFNLIIKLSKKSVKQISEYLSAVKITSDPNNIFENLDKFIGKELKINNSTQLVKTIASFIILLNENSYIKVAENLSNSFKELHSPQINSKDFTSLRNNLEQILKASVNLELSIKSNKLLRENRNVYQTSKVLSDIRIVFNKDINAKNRRAVIVHNLHISYRTDRKNKNFFIALDLEDLNSLQDQIERAIEKDKIIKADYKDFELI